MLHIFLLKCLSFNFMFNFSIIVVCIQFFFSVLGYLAYLTRNILSWKYQVESGFMFLMQYPGHDSPRRDFPDPSTCNLPHPNAIIVAAKGLVGSVFTCSC
jgi:hypothetical protein